MDQEKAFCPSFLAMQGALYLVVRLGISFSLTTAIDWRTFASHLLFPRRWLARTTLV
jgi:hypothetical protein